MNDAYIHRSVLFFNPATECYRRSLGNTTIRSGGVATVPKSSVGSHRGKSPIMLIAKSRS